MTLFERLKTLLPRKYKNLPPHLREGRIGEDAAARYLCRRGYGIVCRNFTSGKNEIDIIAETKDTFILCEVKSRVQTYGEPHPFGRPASAVDEKKKRNLLAAAAVFERRNHSSGKAFRFDVIEVYLSPKYKITHIHHIKNAFMR